MALDFGGGVCGLRFLMRNCQANKGKGAVDSVQLSVINKEDSKIKVQRYSKGVKSSASVCRDPDPSGSREENRKPMSKYSINSKVT